MQKKNSITVFCGSSAGKDPAFCQAAEKLGALIAQQGRQLVYGSGNMGLMGVVSQAAKDHGGRTVGVNVQRFHRLEYEPMSHEYHVTCDLAQRKKVMLDRCDASIALPGGIGTLDELSEVLVQLQIGATKKPLGLLNVNGFYDPFVQLLKKMHEAGFIRDAHLEHLVVCDDAAQLLQALDEI